MPIAIPPPAVPITLPVKSYVHVHMSAHLQLRPAWSPAHLHGFKHAQGDVITVCMFLEDLEEVTVASFLEKNEPIVL